MTKTANMMLKVIVTFWLFGHSIFGFVSYFDIRIYNLL